jgi:pimeloyl-ACP methyl ester carboxylesterase
MASIVKQLSGLEWRPKDEDEYNTLVARNKAFSESCRNMTGPVFDFVDTVSAAKDIEQLRVALNEGKLNFLGQSYGSQLGSRYAELYPQNVGRIVLDGILDHASSTVAALTDESGTYEVTLNKFFE